MGSQRARAACDGGSIYEDRSAFQDVERTARYEGTRLSGKMPSARRLRRKAVRCARAKPDSGCGGELVPRPPLTRTHRPPDRDRRGA
jgi:hypothetical protein